MAALSIENDSVVRQRYHFFVMPVLPTGIATIRGEGVVRLAHAPTHTYLIP